MTDKGSSDTSSKVARLIAIGLGLPWIEILIEAWKLGKKLMRGFSNEGMYEVLEEETTIELLDVKGKVARITKHKRVRYLQNYITTYPIVMWGEGEFPIDFKVSPGVIGDQYKKGHKTILNVSLREEKDKGDIDYFDISWGIQKGFTMKTESWSTGIRHRTHQVKVTIIFPKKRPPKRVKLIETASRRSKLLAENNITELSNGKWRIMWKKRKPKRNEEYMIQWEW